MRLFRGPLVQIEVAEVRLTNLPGWPRGFHPNWMLSDLRDRVIMVAQFECGRYTFEEALYEALGRICVPPEIESLWDDDMRTYAAECNRLAIAAHTAIMAYLFRRRRSK